MRRECGFVAGLNELGIVVGLKVSLPGLLSLLRFHLVSFIVKVVGGLRFELGPRLRTPMFSCVSQCLPHVQMSQAHL
jgi:hypothetical protein